MSTLLNLSNKIKAESFNLDKYAPVDGNEFEWQGFTYKVIVKDYNGTKLAWLDRNLGATQVATSSTDADAYGDLYQWGRLTDGHEKRDADTVEDELGDPKDSDVPGHNKFIFGDGRNADDDWRDPKNDNLWQQPASDTNNPAPPGWHIPTEAQWELERGSWSSNDAAGAFASELKLPMAGVRSNSSGSLVDVGSSGYYWSSTVSGSIARFLFFSSSNAAMLGGNRANGLSVRCVREITS